jgi:hypothetical protein
MEREMKDGREDSERSKFSSLLSCYWKYLTKIHLLVEHVGVQ